MVDQRSDMVHVSSAVFERAQCSCLLMYVCMDVTVSAPCFFVCVGRILHEMVYFSVQLHRYPSLALRPTIGGPEPT